LTVWQIFRKEKLEKIKKFHPVTACQKERYEIWPKKFKDYFSNFAISRNYSCGDIYFCV